MNSKRITLVLFILIPSLFPILPFVESAGYGEENENLGQFTDDFENLNNVSVIDNIIRNSTLDAMQLNTTGGGNEDFTTYTEVDIDNKLTVLTDRVNMAQYERNDHGYVYYDFGVDFFGDFEIFFECNLTDVEAGDASNVNTILTVVVSNLLDDWLGLTTDDALGASWKQDGADDDEMRFGYNQYDGGVAKFQVVEGLGTGHALDTWYCIINRTGTDCDLWVFTDPARTVLLTSFQQTGASTKYRYLMIADCIDSDSDGTDHLSGWIGNVNLGDSADLDGFFTTTNLLNYSNGQSLALLTNASLPAGSEITVQFSNDNATWFDNDGNAGSNILSSGFFSIDLRDLNYTEFYSRYNMSRTGSTPLLYQSRLVTTNGMAGAAGPGPIEESFFWVFIAIVLSIIVGLLVWMKFGNN